MSETHFTAKSYINIPNFNAYHTTYPDGTAHGGTAILIRSKIRHFLTTPFGEEQLQATSVIVEDWIGPITVFGGHIAHRNSILKMNTL